MNIKTFLTTVFCLIAFLSFGQMSPYCNTSVTHFAGDPPSEILLTIQNTGPNSMEVMIESADADPVDLLIVLNGSGATISPEMFPAPGVIVRTLTWGGTPPTDVMLNLLWSKVSFGGNWQLSMTDISIPFLADCIALTAPVTNAPEPTCDPADVVSVYGDFYPTNIATNYNPNWGQSGFPFVDPAYDPGTGNVVLAYPNFNYQGTELTTTDLSGMDYLHFDVWTAADPTNTFLQVTPVQMGPIEFLVDVPYISGEWTKIVLPMSDFMGMSWADVFQMKFAANGPGSTVPVDIYLDNIFFSTCSGVAATAPTTNAPEPTCPAADVVSVYGDFYPTNIATNYNPNWGQSGFPFVDPAYDPGTGNVVLAYPNFNYQGTELTTTDLSGMDYLHFDVWTAADPASTILQVSPINAGTGPGEVLVTAPYVSGEWTSVVLAKSDFGGMTWDAVFQMKFAANGAGSTTPVDIYLDNIYFSTCSPTAPTTNAPEPTCPTADVVSVYGDFYTPSIATNYDPNWGQSGFGLVDPFYDPGTGNVILAYPNFNYQGTELTTTDLSGMDYLHFDVWTAADPASTILQVSPINAGTGPGEVLVTAPYVSGEWTSVVLAKSDFGGMTWDAVFQMKFAANGPGSTVPVDIYLDNIYFSTCAPTAPTTNAPEPTCDPADVVSVYGDFYAPNIATNYDPNWGQSGFGMVNPSYDPGTGNVVLAYPNFNYQGTELITTDLSGMEYLIFDVWTPADPANTFLQVTPIQPGPIEVLVDVPYVSGEWTNIVLPMSDFTGMTWTDVFQMKFAANGPGSINPVDIYLDNIYFSTCNPNQSPYCSTLVTHFAGDPGSEMLLTIKNSGPNSMEVIGKSGDGIALDDMFVPGPASGATISPPVETSPGVFSVTLTWASPPSDVMLNVLWSKEGFGGYWQLSTTSVSVPFEATCPPPPPPCTLMAAECTACETCEESVDVDLTTGDVFNVAQEFGPGFCCFQENPPPNYDSGTNMGTLMLSEGSVNAFSVSGVANLALPDYIADICLTADINVVTGSYPFLLEFRLENGTGAPGNGGEAITFNVMVDGEGMCSVGGGLADGIVENGFEFVPGANYVVAIALADFTGNPIPEDIVVNISNISLSVCAADAEPAMLDCTNSEEQVANGDFSNVDTPSAFPTPADFAVWEEFGDVYDDANTIDPSMKLFGATSGVFQDFPLAEGDWICGYADILTQSIDMIAPNNSWAEVKIEYYDAGGTIINGPNGTVLGDFNLNAPATSNTWTKTGGCLEAPANAVTGRAVIVFLNFSGQGGAVLVDNASFNKINPTYFEANADGCTANADITNPVPSDECGVVTFTNTYNNTEDASGNYPYGKTLVTYTAVDAQGNESCCSILVEVGDMTGPEIDCPNDIFVQLEAGECEELVLFDVPFSDICGSIDAEASQAINEALVNTALDCAFNTSNHLRYFENTALAPVEITEVNFGIFNSGANETVTVNIYMIGPGAPFQYANMILMGSTDHMVPPGMNQVILSTAVEATIPVGMNYVLELKANNTTNFVIGYNASGETESTYISGNPPTPCVSLEPVDIDILGFGAFAVVLYSNAEVGPSIEQTEGLPSGSYYPMGTTTNTFIATDVFGNTTECTFDVTLVEFENGVTGVMSCNDNINVSLDSDCQLELNADMLLEGGAYGCYDDYIIEVSGGVTGNIITNPGTYTVTITDPDTGNSCWSTINVESKAVPVIDCAGALCPIDMLEGEWTADDNTFSPGAAWAFDGFPPNDNILYDVIEFVVTVPGVYTLTMTPSPDFDGIAGIYAGSFDPDMPALNLIGGDDDVPGIFESEPDFMIMLDAGTYFLVSSTWGAGQMGVYTWSFSGPGDLLSACDVKCYELDALLSGDLDIPLPEVTSCIPYEIYYSDAVDYDDCGTTTVTRTYLAENANGSSTCEVTFEIDPVSVALDIRLPEALVVLTCNDGTDPADIVAIFDNPLTNDNSNTAIVENNEGYIYAYPTYEVNGHPQKVDNNVCNVYAAYTDQELDACAEGCLGNRKIIRTWTLVDWCTLEITNFIQTIKAIDTEAPTLITKDITVSTDAWGCEASFEAPLPWELHDNCDSNPEYRITGPAGVVIDGTFEDGYTIIEAPKGVHTFYYIAYDCCDNEASYPFTVTVLDITPPVVVAKQNVVISLTSGSTSGAGLAKLYAESIDNGSYDGCSSTVKLEIRRDEDNCDVRGNATYNADGHPQDGSPNPNSPGYDPDGGAYVKFCCADLDNAVVDVNGDGELDAGYVKVWLRVWDDGDMDGTFGTAGDNYNEAWAFVKVEDKLAPAIQCPPDVTLTCDMDYTDLNMTGSASAFGSCGGLDVEYNDIIVNLNTCNEGFVRRRWNVVGRTDIFCDQTITMEDLDMPVNVSFSQVQDFTAANCPDMIALGEPTWVAGPCDVIGYTMETDTFKFEDGACYKLVNYWTVINWCDYDPNNPFWDGSGLWEHVQVIKVTDETKPVLEDCVDKMYAINDHSDSDDDGEVCEAKITLTNVATDPGSDNCPTGWLKWQVFVDLWGDGTDDLEYSSFLPPFDNQFNDTNGNGIGDVYVAPTANGETVNIPLPDIAGSMSNHKVRWKVTDGCNNVTTCDTEFMVVDKKAPTPYCVDLSTAVMESSGTVELWAIDFNVGSFDNCTAQEDLRYTFTDVAPEDDPNYDASKYSSSKEFDCGDVENSPVEVNMYVWDEKGNSDYCIVYLTIVDNTGACGGKPEIGGTVATASGDGVSEVEVTLEAALPEYPRTEMTDGEGVYVFLENALNATYQISGSKDVDYMNGVSTLDLVKIQRHILGLEELDSPYKLVAADVNADDQIKASDLTQLRKLILGVITELPTNESWRFVDGEQDMSMDMDLADIDYTLKLINLDGNSYGNDMVAVKVGDVTENAVANLANQTTEVRSSKTLALSIENQEVEVGQKVSVDFMSEDFTNVYGYQFTMELKGLSFTGIENGAVEMTEGNVGVLTSNVLTMSYNNTTSISAGNDATIFTIDFIATESGNLSNMIDITSKVTRSEAYVSTSLNTGLGSSLEIRDVVITTRGDITAVEATELYQNEPNPFKGQTVVGFNLAEAGAATMTVFDVTGKVIVTQNIDGVKGYNTVNFTANQLGASGVLYYTLESGDFTATKKMIIIE